MSFIDVDFNKIKYSCNKAQGVYKEDIRTSEGGGLKPINGVVYWHVEEDRLTPDMPKYKVLFAINEGFRIWQPYVPFQFKPTNDPRKAAIQIKFRKNGDSDLRTPFETNVLAYAYFPYKESLGLHGDVFLNEAVNWAEMHKANHVNLLKVFVHELGHALALYHSNFQHDIMFWRYQPDNSINITQDTKEGMARLYGEVGSGEPNEPKEEPKDETYLNAIKELVSVRGKRFLQDLVEDELLIIAERIGVEASKDDLKKDTVNKLYKKLK